MNSGDMFVFRLLMGLLIILLSGCATQPKPSIPESNVTETKSKPAFMLESLPSGLNKLLQQAQSQHEQTDTDAAIATLKQAHRDYPTFPQPIFNQALIRFDQEDYSATDQLLEQALLIRDEYPPALNLKGVLARIAGDFEQARSWYQRSIDKAPKYGNAWLNLAVLADLYLQQLALAEKAYQEYLAIHQDDENVTNWLLDLQRRMPTNGSPE